MQFTGKVIHGVQVGSKFGIATANLELLTKPDLEEGVYLVDLNNNLEGIMHFGDLKTFGAGFSAEVHILNFDQDIYGETLTVTVLKKLRDVQHFPNSDALFTQIEKDIIQARKFFMRSRIKNNWEQITPAQKTDWAEKAVTTIEKISEFQSATTIYAYAPDDQEIPFVQKLCKKYSDKTWCFPKVTGGGLTFHQSTYQDLTPGYLDLLEPNATKPAPAPELIFVPAVAANRNGQRLGRGGGFYDRFLANQKSYTISVLPAFAVLEGIPVETHDQEIDKAIKII